MFVVFQIIAKSVGIVHGVEKNRAREYLNLCIKRQQCIENHTIQLLSIIFLLFSIKKIKCGSDFYSYIFYIFISII